MTVSFNNNWHLRIVT